jgi:hypothetical protein
MLTALKPQLLCRKLIEDGKRKGGISEPKRNACDTCRIISYLNSSSNKDFRAPSSANACIHALTNEP